MTPEAILLIQPTASVMTKLYVPEFAEVMLDITGIASEEVKPFGPVHEYVYGVVPPLAVLVKVKSLVPSTHARVWSSTFNVIAELIVTATFAISLVHPSTVTLTA